MPEAAAAGTGCRALVIDDDPVVRMLASQALAAMGFNVMEAEDGESGLDAIDHSPADLVLLDIQMPGMDGFETCAALRQHRAGKEIPVLVMTGLTDALPVLVTTSLTDAETIDRAFQAGATDFIKKPIDWQVLQYRVRFLMRAHDAFSDLRRTVSELRESEGRLANAQRLARMGHWEWTVGSDEMLWSEEVFRIVGIEPRPGAATYQAFLGIVHPDDRPGVEKAMQRAVSEAEGWSLDHRIACAEGPPRIVHQQAEVMQGESGGIECISGTIQDITDRRRAEEQLRFLTRYDSLTALPNRKMLTEYLDRVLTRSRGDKETVALLCLDLDLFKRINDTLGHVAGDELLKAVAARLTASVRPTDQVGRAEAGEPATVSRLGGDEFTLILKGVRSPEDAGQVARRVLETLRRPFTIQRRTMVMSASIGIALFPHDGCDANTLLRNASSALDYAKARGRDAYQFFNESMNEKATRKLQLESALRAALDNNELVLHYQPQLHAHTSQINGVEALVRWQSPEFGVVGPGEFIPLAEELGLIGAVGDWVLQSACAQARAWQMAGLAPIRVGVNVSSHQVHKPGLVERVEEILRESEMDPSLLEVEITESALLADDPAVEETLSRLGQLGVRLALDDFGTGYSSLSHLFRFPIDVVKIDCAFVQRIGTDGHADSLIAALVDLAHGLQLSVTAEGIETAQQEQFLRSEGCDTLQGYRFGRPVDAEALAALLAGRGKS